MAVLQAKFFGVLRLIARAGDGDDHLVLLFDCAAALDVNRRDELPRELAEHVGKPGARDARPHHHRAPPIDDAAIADRHLHPPYEHAAQLDLVFGMLSLDAVSATEWLFGSVDAIPGFESQRASTSADENDREVDPHASWQTHDEAIWSSTDELVVSTSRNPSVSHLGVLSATRMKHDLPFAVVASPHGEITPHPIVRSTDWSMRDVAGCKSKVARLPAHDRSPVKPARSIQVV